MNVNLLISTMPLKSFTLVTFVFLTLKKWKRLKLFNAVNSIICFINNASPIGLKLGQSVLCVDLVTITKSKSLKDNQLIRLHNLTKKKSKRVKKLLKESKEDKLCISKISKLNSNKTYLKYQVLIFIALMTPQECLESLLLFYLRSILKTTTNNQVQSQTSKPPMIISNPKTFKTSTSSTISRKLLWIYRPTSLA